MLKEKLLKIKENESNAIFGRKNSQINHYKNEIENFFNHSLFMRLTFMDKVRFIIDDSIDYYEGEFIYVFEKHLIRSDGKLNSPLLRNKHVKEFLKRFDAIYPELKTYDVEHKWFYLKNNLDEIPKCDGCGIELKKFVWGKRFCTQNCAVTSKEAKLRSSETSKGRTHSDKLKKINSERMKKLWKTDEHRKKVLPKLKEVNQRNGNHFLNDDGKPWNYGIPMSTETIKKAMKTKKERGIDFSGKGNPQFGKIPSPKAGRGINGKYKNSWFRSSLELFYLMYFDEYDIEFRTAETAEFKVEYKIDNVIKTYSPDFFLISENKIIEVKPEKRISEKLIKLKMKALQEKFGNDRCEFRTENNIKSFIKSIDLKLIYDKIDNKDLVMSSDQEKRLLNKFERIVYEYTRNL